jgi:hypothetical protein
MTKGWTEERRQKARERILANKPWERSTGPRTQAGKETSSLNALKHGGRSRVWDHYIRKILQTNEVVQLQAVFIHEYEMKNARLTNELIKKRNKYNGDGPTPYPKNTNELIESLSPLQGCSDEGGGGVSGGVKEDDVA